MSYAELISSYENDITDTPWNVYPRPQLKRESFISLNGKWDLFIPGARRGSLDKFRITVPFPVQSKISGVMKNLKRGEGIIYSRRFDITIPENRSVILHFGAVDQICRVYINSYFAIEHKGGYLPFDIDITGYVQNGENELMLEVTDDIDRTFPYGKQKDRHSGMWYTPVSGIWQTVWIELVPKNYIKKVRIRTHNDNLTFEIIGGEAHKDVYITTPFGMSNFSFEGDRHTVKIPGARFWSPADPYLYDYSIVCGDDKISGYFALRDVEISDGKICLNGKPIFLNAILDQGYYSDGIYLPATPEEYENDIKLAKQMGFNALRKHLKIEPLYFYYLCDKLGILVMQDFVQSGEYSFIRDTLLPTLGLKKLPPRNTDKETIANFVQSCELTAELLAQSPCVIYYTVFNEGWGQFSEKRCDIYEKIKAIDDGKIIDTASGWFRVKKTDVISDHIYFGKFDSIAHSKEKPNIISEFGGITLKIGGHTFSKKEYGYKKSSSPDELFKKISQLYSEKLIPEIKKGLSGAVYTQLSDVEDELNGLITYDRAVVKIDIEKMRELSDSLYKQFELSLTDGEKSEG